jgi:hypothetical protein
MLGGMRRGNRLPEHAQGFDIFILVLVATGSIHTMHRHGRVSADHRLFMFKNFSYIPPRCSIAQPEPPPELIPVPVFRSDVPVVDDGPELVGVILQGITQIIRREIQALRAQDVARNSTSVTLESAMAMLGCKRSKVFDLLDQGLLTRAPRVGRSVLVTVASIEALSVKKPTPKRGKRSREPGRRAALVNRRIHSRSLKCEKNADAAKQDPGALIRKINV